MAEKPPWRTRKRTMYLQKLDDLKVGEVLRRRRYLCKACDSEVPLALFWNTGAWMCAHSSCLAKFSGPWAGCRDCRAVVCSQCILGLDMLLVQFELAMTAAPAVGAQQAALADQAEAAPPAVAGRTIARAALCDTAAPDEFLLLRAQKVSYRGYDCYWDDQRELWAYDSDGRGKLKRW